MLAGSQSCVHGSALTRALVHVDVGSGDILAVGVELLVRRLDLPL